MLGALKELAEGYLFDPSFVDIVVWFPHLSWGEFAVSVVTVAGWRWLTDRIEKAIMTRLRRAASALLGRLAAKIRAARP